MDAYVPRLTDPLLEGLAARLPALFIVGPRGVGKTTSARRLARTVARLDGPDAGIFRADPDAALRGLEEPVLLDEWQAVPEVLGAVKRTLDDEPFRPGRYLITGSQRSASDPVVWPGTGRLVRVTLHGLNERELAGHAAAPSPLDTIITDGPARLETGPDPPDLRGYMELALMGGFPEARLHVSGADRPRWLDSYVETLVSRDAGLIDTTRNPVLLKRYLSVLAASSATIPNHRSLYQAAGIDRKTAVAYDGLLEGAVVQQTLPAWFTNRLKRIAKLPKRYLTDTALVAALVGADVQAAMRDVHLAGRLLDTFVAAQLRPELTVSSCRPTLYHLRTEHGHEEIDILAEVQGGGLVAFEVKTGSFDKHDAKHLRWLRDRIDDRFIAGIVLHTGRFKVEIDDRIWAMPVCSLWSSG